MRTRATRSYQRAATQRPVTVILNGINGLSVNAAGSDKR